MVRSAWVYAVGSLALTAACTSILGIDDTYVVGVSSSTGGRHAKGPDGGFSGGAGGATDSGGTTSTGDSGGTSESGGGSGGTLDAGEKQDANVCKTPCATGEKCCYGNCVKPSPLFGCSLTTCDSCTDLPDNATGVCANSACSFECITGYQKSGAACVVKSGGSGGNGGVQGTGGTTATCSVPQCPACIGGFIYSACCEKSTNKCGCAFPGAPCFAN
jgi:hypothetical protein